jgi:hypothetical protein
LKDKYRKLVMGRKKGMEEIAEEEGEEEGKEGRG